ncbi:MAG: ATP-binding protein [Thermodesulfobacteriota bacterium]
MDPKKENSRPRWWTSLRGRIIFLLAVLLAVNLAGALLTLWFTFHIRTMHSQEVNRNLAALLKAQDLMATLLMQKGFATYYFLNKDQQWLDQLETYNLRFEKLLQEAREVDYEKRGLDLLAEIEANYIRYTFARDQVINLYKEGRNEDGAKLHWEVRGQFHEIYNLAEEYKGLHQSSILAAQKYFLEKARFMIVLAVVAVPCTTGLGVILALVLFRQILGPIRRMAVETNGHRSRLGDEVKTIGQKMKSLKEDMNQAQFELEQSREQLMHSEKLALVGKMAAGVAHSVRNPLTSVKMRLFSLERGLRLSPEEKEDFEVISEEIRHIDTIVGNFLEFSRAPKLRKQMVSLSDVVDSTLDLIRHRLESHGAELTVHREQPLPECPADPEQIKEALMNLIFNACEAIADGGSIEIREQVREVGRSERELVIRVIDDGPGIPDSAKDKIFEPFFSAKEEGAGLGLSIARRIVEEHGGRLELESSNVQGTTFILIMPLKEA